jgi:monovalent cation/hydrogen antiporter
VALVLRSLRRIRHDPLIANTISLATPFAAYLLGESVHVSGVLAVVIAGLIIGHDSPRYTGAASRLQTTAVWRLVDFVLEGMVFLLIGQQLPTVLGRMSDYGPGTVMTALGVSVGVVLLLRPLWLIFTQWLPGSLHTRLGGEAAAEEAPDSVRARILDKALNGREVTALSWAGTRGVITLAAIFTLPPTVPQQGLLQLCAFTVVLVTLVAQGLTFGPLVRWLGLRANQTDLARERNEARSAAVRAALDRLDEIQDEKHDNVEDRAIENMRKQLEVRLERYRRRLDLLDKADSDEVPTPPQYEAALMVRRAVIGAQREELLRWRDAGNLNDEGLRILERELDHEERLLPDRS